MPPPTTTSPPAPPPQQHHPTNNLPSLPSPPSWLLPTALLILALSVLATLLVYRLTFPRGSSSSTNSDDDNDDSDGDESLNHAGDHADEEATLDTHIPRFATGTSRPAGRQRTRIQRIWAERRRKREQAQTEMETLLPATPKRWADGGGGGSGASPRGWGGGRRRGGYVRVPEVEGGSGIEVVEVDGGDGGEREERGWLEMVDAGLDWCVEKAVGYLGDEGGEEGLVFPVTEEERGERVGWD